MKLVYIAGPYRAYREDGNYEISTMLERTMEMRKVTKRYLEKGYAVIAPLTNHFMLDTNDLDDNFWMHVCKELVSRCDAIVMMKGHESSKGATEEMAYAKSLGKEVMYDNG